MVPSDASRLLMKLYDYYHYVYMYIYLVVPSDASRHHPEFTACFLQASSGYKGLLGCLLETGFTVCMYVYTYIHTRHQPRLRLINIFIVNR